MLAPLTSSPPTRPFDTAVFLSKAMDMFQPETNQVWDLSPQASQYAQINDDDFLALFKQYPPADTNTYTQHMYMGGSINPQNLNDFALPGLTPPSDDSSPSPPAYSEPRTSRRTSMARPTEDSALKRKASDESLDDGPTHKSAHTGEFPDS